MSANVLRALLLAEKTRRGISSDEKIGEMLGVKHTTVGRILRGETKEPNLDTLIQLARFFEMDDVCVLIALIRPDAFNPSTKDRLINSWVNRLPESKRKFVDLALSGVMFESDD